jgi:dihydrofolate reductase
VVKLVYTSIVSLDGYVEDERGRFDWAVPDDEVHAYMNDLERSFGTYLYGRRMYETMAGWETDPRLAAQSQVMADFAHTWQAAEKVVYSTTLATVRPPGPSSSARSTRWRSAG